MNRSIIRSWGAVLLVTAALLIAGCKGDAPPAAEGTNAGEANPSNEGAAEAAKTPKTTAEDPGKDKAPSKTETAPTPGEAPAPGKAPTDKETLAKAYVEIYCAQRKKETERLLEIYTRYGFADPKTWTASWTEAAKDDAWVAEITQKAIQTCP